MAIGQGLLAASPMQLAVGYSAIANGGYVMVPRVMSGDPRPEHARRRHARHGRHVSGGRRAGVHPGRASDRHARRTCATPSSPASARTSPGRAPTAAAPPPRSCSPPATRATPSTIAGKTGTAQGFGSYPVERLVGVRRRRLRRRRAGPPLHRGRLPREGGLRIARGGAGGEVHVPRAVRHDPARPGRGVRPARPHQRSGRPPAAPGRHRLPAQLRPQHRVSRHAGWRRGSSTDAPWSACSSASPTPGWATSAPVRPTRAATSTGCCCWCRACSPSSGAPSSTRPPAPARADSFRFLTRQVIFAIVAGRADGGGDDRSTTTGSATGRARSTSARWGCSSGLLLLGQLSGGTRISFDLGPINVQPAEFAKFTVLLMLAAYLAEERTDEVSYPRFLGGLIIVGLASVLVHRPARPRVGVGARGDGDGHAARRRRQGPLHRGVHVPVPRHGRRRLHRPSGERLPARAGARRCSTRTTRTCASAASTRSTRRSRRSPRAASSARAG